jgi:hypothetical protein
MADLIIPDPRWEMPELLYPRRQPVGELAVDYSNPITKDINAAYVFNKLSPGTTGIHKGIIPNDLFGGFYPINGASWTPAGSVSTTDNDALASVNTTIAGTDMEPSTMLMVYRRVVPVASFGYMMYLENFLRYSIYPTSTGEWQLNGASVTPTISDPSYTVSNSQMKCAVFSRLNSTTVSLVVEDQYAVGGTGSGALAASNTFHLNGRDDSGSRYSGCEIQSFFFWKRVLTKEEMLAVSRDPYQFLIPA